MKSRQGKSEVPVEELEVVREGSVPSRNSYLSAFGISLFVIMVALLFPRGSVPSAGCPFRISFERSCPACGLTRGVQDIFMGEMSRAVQECPLSLVVVLMLLGVLIWGLIGLLFNYDIRQRLWKISVPVFLFVSLGLVVLNWAYRLSKGYV